MRDNLYANMIDELCYANWITFLCILVYKIDYHYIANLVHSAGWSALNNLGESVLLPVKSISFAENKVVDATEIINNGNLKVSKGIWENRQNCIFIYDEQQLPFPQLVLQFINDYPFHMCYYVLFFVVVCKLTLLCRLSGVLCCLCSLPTQCQVRLAEAVTSCLGYDSCFDNHWAQPAKLLSLEPHQNVDHVHDKVRRCHCTDCDISWVVVEEVVPAFFHASARWQSGISSSQIVHPVCWWDLLDPLFDEKLGVCQANGTPLGEEVVQSCVEPTMGGGGPQRLRIVTELHSERLVFTKWNWSP